MAALHDRGGVPVSPWLPTSWNWRGSFFDGLEWTVHEIIQPTINAYGLGPFFAALFIVGFVLVLFAFVKR